MKSREHIRKPLTALTLCGRRIIDVARVQFLDRGHLSAGSCTKCARLRRLQ